MADDYAGVTITKIPGQPTTYQVTGERLGIHDPSRAGRLPVGQAVTITISANPDLTSDEELAVVKMLMTKLLDRLIDSGA